MADPIGWSIAKSPHRRWEVSKTYIERIETDDGRFWGKVVVTINSKEFDEEEDDYRYSFTIDTLLDGSPGLLDGWSKGINDETLYRR